MTTNPDALFHDNQRLAFFMAGKFARRAEALGLDRADLDQEALCTLWKAACGFDPAYGCPFSAYACRAIQNCLLQVCTKAARTAPRLRGLGDNDPAAPALPAAPDHETIDLLLAPLNVRERELVRAYVGLDTGERQAMPALAARHGITKQRVQQLLARGLAKARLGWLRRHWRRFAQRYPAGRRRRVRWE